MNFNTEAEDAKAVLEKETYAIKEVANRFNPQEFTKENTIGSYSSA